MTRCLVTQLLLLNVRRLPVYKLPSGLAYMPGQSSVQTVLASGRPLDRRGGPLIRPRLRTLLGKGHLTFDMNPAFGLQLHQPRFLEFIGALESAWLLCRSPTFWVDRLGEEQSTCRGTLALCCPIFRLFRSLLRRCIECRGKFGLSANSESKT